MLQVHYRSHDGYSFKAVTLDQNENTTMTLCKKIKTMEALKDTDLLYILNAEDSRFIDWKDSLKDNSKVIYYVEPEDEMEEEDTFINVLNESYKDSYEQVNSFSNSQKTTKKKKNTSNSNGQNGLAINQDSQKDMNGEEESYLCPFCKNTMKNAVISSCCGESFCESCIMPKVGSNCPICSLKITDFLPNKKLREQIQAYGGQYQKSNAFKQSPTKTETVMRVEEVKVEVKPAPKHNTVELLNSTSTTNTLTHPTPIQDSHPQPLPPISWLNQSNQMVGPPIDRPIHPQNNMRPPPPIIGQMQHPRPYFMHGPGPGPNPYQMMPGPMHPPMYNAYYPPRSYPPMGYIPPMNHQLMPPNMENKMIPEQPTETQQTKEPESDTEEKSDKKKAKKEKKEKKKKSKTEKRSSERQKDKKRSRSRSKEKAREKDRERDRESERDREKDRERDKDKDRDRDREKDRDYEKDKKNKKKKSHK